MGSVKAVRRLKLRGVPPMYKGQNRVALLYHIVIGVRVPANLPDSESSHVQPLLDLYIPFHNIIGMLALFAFVMSADITVFIVPISSVLLL